MKVQTYCQNIINDLLCDEKEIFTELIRNFLVLENREKNMNGTLCGVRL